MLCFRTIIRCTIFLRNVFNNLLCGKDIISAKNLILQAANRDLRTECFFVIKKFKTHLSILCLQEIVSQVAKIF